MKFDRIQRLDDHLGFDNQEGVNQIRNSYETLNKLDNEAINKLFTKFKIDTKSRYANFKFNDEDEVTVQLYPNDIRDKRRQLRDNFREIMIQTYIEHQNEIENIKSSIEGLSSNRDLPKIFADFKISETETLNGKEFAKNIVEAKTNSDKVTLINKHLEKLINRANELFEPCSDEEFANRFKEMNKIVTVFANDSLVSSLEKYANVTFNDAAKNKITGLREYANGLGHKMVERTAIIGNSGYEFMSNEDLFEVSKRTSQYDTFWYFGTQYNGAEVDPLNDIGGFSAKLEFTYEPLGSLKAINKVKDGDILFGVDGPVNEQQANGIIKDGKILGVKDSKGNIKAVGFNKDMFAVSKEVHKDFNKKNACQRMLDTLNNETHWYNPSSKEYREMRKTLAEMVEGKGNDYEHIAALRENARKYIDNHEFKSKKEGLASRRKACVESMLEQLNTCEFDLLVGDSIREHALSNENSNETVEKKQVFDDKMEILNSSSNHLTEEEKQMFTTKTSEKNIQNEEIKEN